LHDSSPVQRTVQRPKPHHTPFLQLFSPEHSTRHGPVAGQNTCAPQLFSSAQRITHTPFSQVPPQPGAHASGGGASGLAGASAMTSVPSTLASTTTPGNGATHDSVKSVVTHQPSDRHV
jgi:hypothetical protein